MDSDSRPRSTKLLFKLLAWISPLLPCVACVTLPLWYVKPIDEGRLEAQYKEYQANQVRKSQLRQVAVGIIFASVAGGLVGVVSLCGTRSARAAGAAVLAISLNMLVFGAAGLMYMSNPPRNPFSPA